MDQTDILIAGGGIAGLTAAARLAADGHQVFLVDPAPAGAKTGDLRTTAFFQPSIATLERAGVWAEMAASGAALKLMRIVDAGGTVRDVRETADFSADSAGHGVFGFNVPNIQARQALIDRLEGLSNVMLKFGAAVTGFVSRLDRAIVRLSDGTQMAARLVLAADGRDSALRQMAGLSVRRWEYGQSAVVCAVTHARPHQGVSTEIHRSGGPLTLVPMPDRDGKPCSSVVWMTPSSRAVALAGIDTDDFNAELTTETMGLYGPLQLTGARARWPILSQIAPEPVSRRLALIAEAAHVMPPIGAQGLNTSLHDIETMARLIEAAQDPGDEAVLNRYRRHIVPRTVARVVGVDLLNRAAMAESQPLRDLRRIGLRAIHGFKPLRDLAVRAGMGG